MRSSLHRFLSRVAQGIGTEFLACREVIGHGLDIPSIDGILHCRCGTCLARLKSEISVGLHPGERSEPERAEAE